MSKDVFNILMLGIFVPLGLFSVVSAVTLWRVVAIPAIRANAAWRYAVGVGGAFVSAALAMECVTYGLIRWDPADFGWLNIAYWWVITPKVLYLIGVLMIQTASTHETGRPSKLLRLGAVAACLWLAGSTVAYWSR